MEYKPGELEKRIEQLPEKLVNSVEVIESGKKYLYEGKISNIYEYDGILSGKYALKKFEIIPSKKIWGIELPSGKKQIYSFNCGDYCSGMIIDSSEDYPMNSSVDFLEKDSARRLLYIQTSNHDIILQKTLLDLVFGDIETKLFKIYQDRKQLKLILSKNKPSSSSTEMT